MKRVAILIFLFVCLTAKSQVAYSDITVVSKDYGFYDISKVDDDTTYWFRVKGKIPIQITVEFTDFSNDSCTLDIYGAKELGDSVYYNSIDGLMTTDLPMTLVKATYLDTVESDSISSIGFESDYWVKELLGVHLNPTNNTTGTVKILIDR